MSSQSCWRLLRGGVDHLLQGWRAGLAPRSHPRHMELTQDGSGGLVQDTFIHVQPWRLLVIMVPGLERPHCPWSRVLPQQPIQLQTSWDDSWFPLLGSLGCPASHHPGLSSGGKSYNGACARPSLWWLCPRTLPPRMGIPESAQRKSVGRASEGHRER